jgi:TolB-like protein
MTKKPAGYQRLFADLKRRAVFKVAAVYGAVAFAVLEVSDLVIPALDLPEWTLTFIVAIAAVGFPFALVLAWAFEKTPEGVRRTDPATTGELEAIVAQPAGRRWPSGLLALAGILLLYGGGWWVIGRSARGARVSDDSQAARSVAVEAASAPEPADRRTLAVLPFENMNPDEESALFTSGIHDDILTQLSKIRALSVTSRTTVMEYAETEKSVPEIAAELRVAHILEGAVRRAGNRVRMNVQLIDANADEHLWAERSSRARRRRGCETCPLAAWRPWMPITVGECCSPQGRRPRIAHRWGTSSARSSSTPSSPWRGWDCSAHEPG